MKEKWRNKIKVYQVYRYPNIMENHDVLIITFSNIEAARKYILSQNINGRKQELMSNWYKVDFTEKYTDFFIRTIDVLDNYIDIERVHLRNEAEELRKKLKEIEDILKEEEAA